MRIIGVLLLAACAFDNEIAEEAPVDDGNQQGDHQDPPRLKCNAADQNGLVFCVDFEDAPVFGDAFGTQTSAQNVGPMVRTTESAARFTATSSYTIAETPKLDVVDVTMEMWIRPEQELYGYGEQGLFDNGSYTLVWEAGRKIECSVGGGYSGTRLTSSASLPLDAWAHVACTIAGNELRVYVNGKLEGCRSGSIGTASTGGSAIGATVAGNPYMARFIGQLDNVRVYNRKLEGDDLCRIATGSTGCGGSCGDE